MNESDYKRNNFNDDLQLMDQFNNMNIKNNRKVTWSNNLKIKDENQSSDKTEKIHKRKKTPLKFKNENINDDIDMM